MEAIYSNKCQDFVKPMPDRIKPIIKAKIGNTRYGSCISTKYSKLFSQLGRHSLLFVAAFEKIKLHIYFFKNIFVIIFSL